MQALAPSGNEMIAKPRIALIHNVLIHYRIPLFNLLAASNSWEFHFYFGAVHPWMKQAASTNRDYRPHFKCSILRGLSILEYNYFSPWLIFWLIRGRYDVYIGGPLSSPDCLITFLLAKCLRKRFILWDERWQISSFFLSRVAEPFQRLIAKMADCIIVPGSKSFQYFHRTLRKDRAHCLIIAPDASVLKRPSEASLERFRSSYGIPPGRRTIVYLGRLLPKKGVDNLLRAFATIENEFGDEVFLLVAGQGEEERNLRILANSLGLRNVRFILGEIQEQAACLCTADVVVLPSTGKRGGDFHPPEVWGLVVSEAASLGKPVVVSDVAGSAIDLVSKFECGYVVQDGDHVGLHRAIRSILIDPKLAQRMGRNGVRAITEAFSYEKMVQGFDRAIRQTSKAERADLRAGHALGAATQRIVKHQSRVSLQVRKLKEN